MFHETPEIKQETPTINSDYNTKHTNIESSKQRPNNCCFSVDSVMRWKIDHWHTTIKVDTINSWPKHPVYQDNVLCVNNRFFSYAIERKSSRSFLLTVQLATRTKALGFRSQ